MKKIFLLGMTVSALLLSNCSNEEIMEKAPVGNVVVSATMENGNITRSNVDDNGYFTWLKGDDIAVYTTNTESRWAKFSLQGDGGSATGSFTGTIIGGAETSICAVYPYNDGTHTLSGNTLTFHMPESYDYKEGNTNAPMLALIASEGSTEFPFKHLGGVLRFKVNNVPANATQFVFTTSHQITGDFTVADITAADAEISTPSESSSSNIVTIKMEALSEPSDKIFYIPMPVGTYTSMKIELKDGDGKVLNESSTIKSNTISRRTLLRMPTITCTDVEGSIVANASDVNSLNELLSTTESADKLSSITLSGDGVKNISTPITIPETYTNVSGAEDAPKVLNLTFDKVPTADSQNAIVIKDANTAATTAAQSKAKVEVSIPAVAETETAPSFDITLPAATVTLSATGESATYNEVKASTAANTLVVDKGVTVTKLIVKGGNVRVKNGGTITDIVRDEGNADEVTTIIKEAEANLTNLPSSTNIVVVDAEAADLKAAFAKGGEYVLTSDVDITKASVTVPVDKEVTLDLNGCTIKAANSEVGRITVLGKFTLRDSKGNGKIEATVDYGTGYTTTLIMADGENAHVTMESGYINAVRGKGHHGIGVWGGAGFTMTGGKIEAGYYAIAGNGTNSSQNSIIKIQGGELISTADYAVYLPHLGTTTITGGKINGACGGIAINRGTLNISGDAEILSKDEGNTGNWSDGTGGMGNAALVVEGKYGDCTVNISGGKFESLKNAALIDNHAATNTQKSITITGGTFSDPTALDYLVENANIDVVLNKDCSIPAFNLTKEGQKVTVDLATHTLTLSDEHQSNISATASFKNGSIKMSNVKHQIWGVGGKLTFDKVHMSGSNYALIVQGPDATLDVINGSKIEANYFPLSTNAGIKDGELTYGANATINLKDSEFIGTETGFMNNVPAVVTMDNCKFSGNHQAALLRGGEYTIKNSIFTLNAELGASHSDNKHLVDWGTGNKAAFAGITIGNYKINAYKYYSKVTMERVIVKVEGTNASSFPAMHVCANSDSEMGVTLTYDTYSTFTSAYSPSIEYGTTNITVNGDAVTEKNGIFTVEEGFSN